MKLHLSIILAALLPALIQAQYETYYEEECVVPENDQADVVEKDGTIYLTTTLTKTVKSTRTVCGKAPKTRLRVRTLTKTSKTLITLSPTSTTASSTFTTTCSPSWTTTSSGYTTATSMPSSGSSQPCYCPTSSTGGGGVVPTSGTIAPTTGTGTGTVGPTQTTGSTNTPTPTSSTPGCPCVTQTVTKTAGIKCRTVVIWNPVRTTCQAPSTTVTISI